MYDIHSLVVLKRQRAWLNTSYYFFIVSVKKGSVVKKNFYNILRLFDPHFHTGNGRMPPLNANRPHM